MLYRAVFTAESDQKFKASGHHPINIILHFLSYYDNLFKPDQIHVFWDAERETTWRRDLMSHYKDHRKDQERLVEAGDRTSVLAPVCIELFENMGFRQYYRQRMEADDLIYAFCRVNRQSQIIIVSSDGDMKQIPYHYNNVAVHNPFSKTRDKFEATPTIDPVMYKSLVGDKSDNVDGYYGIGKVKATAMCQDIRLMLEFVNSDKAVIKEGEIKVPVREKVLRENYKVIDLGLCPGLLDNMLYILKKQSKPATYDANNIGKLIIKRKLRGVSAAMIRYISPFKRLGETNGSIDQSGPSPISEDQT